MAKRLPAPQTVKVGRVLVNGGRRAGFPGFMDSLQSKVEESLNDHGVVPEAIFLRSDKDVYIFFLDDGGGPEDPDEQAQELLEPVAMVAVQEAMKRNEPFIGWAYVVEAEIRLVASEDGKDPQLTPAELKALPARSAVNVVGEWCDPQDPQGGTLISGRSSLLLEGEEAAPGRRIAETVGPNYRPGAAFGFFPVYLSALQHATARASQPGIDYCLAEA